ncbi:MAG: CDP-glucose 4,6-dehydratase [Geothrix sp.]
MDAAFWRGKRVFLTGHTGFKGSWLSLWLQAMGAEVHGYALAPATDPALYDLAQVGQGMVSTLGDIRDLPRLTAALQQARPQVVLHLAAQALVRASYTDPVGTYGTNVMGTVHLLEAVRATPSVQAVVVVTSDKCYENREWLWGYREDEPMGGYDPYSNSKGCAELVVSAYRRSFFPAARYGEHGVALASARAGNVIGGGDWADDRLVPDVLRALEAGEPAIIRSPGAVRPWQHVLEPLSGYLDLAQALVERGPAFGESWNFGPFDVDARPVQHLVASLVGAWGEAASFRVEAPADAPHEAHLLKLDTSKARARLHWRPRWSLETCLARIVEWHRAKVTGADPRALTLAQIAAYQATSPDL